MQFTVDTIARILGIKDTRGIATLSWWAIWTRDRVRPMFRIAQAVLAVYALVLLGDQRLVG